MVVFTTLMIMPKGQEGDKCCPSLSLPVSWQLSSSIILAHFIAKSLCKVEILIKRC